jgi:hypothetical protein
LYPEDKISSIRCLNTYHRYTITSGNTILEYVLIGLVLLLCIGGFSLLSTNWNDIMKQFKQDMLSHNQAATNANALQKQQIANAQAQVQAQAQQAATSATNSASSASVATNTQTVETVGANGNTDTFASEILSNAKQALASGKLTQTEYDLIARLANKGHDIAQIQGLLENAYTTSKGNSSAYATSQLTFNGQSYTPSQLNSILESNISDFGALRSQASVQNGVLYDQALLTSINNSGAQIINSGYASQQQNQTAASFIQYQDGGLGVSSTDTHEQSAVICTNGEHLDINNHCVP